MLKTIVPAVLEFRDGVPYSAAYGATLPSSEGNVAHDCLAARNRSRKTMP